MSTEVPLRRLAAALFVVLGLVGCKSKESTEPLVGIGTLGQLAVVLVERCESRRTEELSLSYSRTLVIGLAETKLFDDPTLVELVCQDVATGTEVTLLYSKEPPHALLKLRAEGPLVARQLVEGDPTKHRYDPYAYPLITEGPSDDKAFLRAGMYYLGALVDEQVRAELDEKVVNAFTPDLEGPLRQLTTSVAYLKVGIWRSGEEWHLRVTRAD
jgi:hypothetical protein